MKADILCEIAVKDGRITKKSMDKARGVVESGFEYAAEAVLAKLSSRPQKHGDLVSLKVEMIFNFGVVQEEDGNGNPRISP